MTANSYAWAVNEFMKQSIDVLLCDIEMPYGSGQDLVKLKRYNLYVIIKNQSKAWQYL